MALTRRQFLTRTGVAAAGSFLVPGFFRNPLLQKALADTIGDRYFVVIFLDGGNDGLNTITPYDNVGGLRVSYEAARGTGAGGLRLLPGELSVPTNPFLDPNTGAQLGFHPGLVGLKNLYDAGKVAVIQGCGYPNYDLSHAVSASVFQTANPAGAGVQGGWMGRYLAANYGGTEIPAVCVQDQVAGEFTQSTTSVLAVRRLRDFGFPYDPYDSGDDNAKRTAFLALCGNAIGNAQASMKFVGNSGNATMISTESYPQAHTIYRADRDSWNNQYTALNSGTASNLREVAKMIYGNVQGTPNVDARFFELANGGYDTHSDQAGAAVDGQHYALHRELGDAIELFYNDINDMQAGLADKVCVLVYSEFSRRIEQNDNGTDHGSQGPMFVIGGSVQGGVYGNHPDITPASLDNQGNTTYSQNAGNGYRSTDFRDVYGTIMKHWLNMPQPQILTDVLPLDSGAPSNYWTTSNFDMGFLV